MASTPKFTTRFVSPFAHPAEPFRVSLTATARRARTCSRARHTDADQRSQHIQRQHTKMQPIRVPVRVLLIIQRRYSQRG
jgi:hypothetical protein